MVVKKNNKKTNISAAVWFLIILGLLVLAAVYLVDGRLLKTSLVGSITPSPSGGAGGRDWKTIGAPGLSAEMVGPTKLCPSPTPFLGYIPTPSVTPDVGECGEFHEARGKNNYNYVIRKDGDSVITKTFNGSTPEGILRALCWGSPPPTYCGSGDKACSWMSYDGGGSFEIRLMGLYEKVNEMFKLVDNAYVYPDGPGRPGTREWVTGVYPSAPAGRETVPIRFGASVWGIGEDGVQILKEVHPKLVDVAEIQTNWMLNHEKEHWRYFERYLPEYFSMINSPWYDTDWSLLKLESLRDLIGDEFWSGWQAIAALEKAEHDAFDDRTAELRRRKSAYIPLDGLHNIWCDDIKGIVYKLKIEVKEMHSGYVEANYDRSRGRRILGCNTQCEKTYFASTPIKIKALAEVEDGYKFKEWKSGESVCSGCAGSKSEECVLQISGDNHCIAVFEKTEVPGPS